MSVVDIVDSVDLVDGSCVLTVRRWFFPVLGSAVIETFGKTDLLFKWRSLRLKLPIQKTACNSY
jgi:hypothetical protein